MFEAELSQAKTLADSGMISEAVEIYANILNGFVGQQTRDIASQAPRDRIFHLESVVLAALNQINHSFQNTRDSDPKNPIFAPTFEQLMWQYVELFTSLSDNYLSNAKTDPHAKMMAELNHSRVQKIITDNHLKVAGGTKRKESDSQQNLNLNVEQEAKKARSNKPSIEFGYEDSIEFEKELEPNTIPSQVKKYLSDVPREPKSIKSNLRKQGQFFEPVLAEEVNNNNASSLDSAESKSKLLPLFKEAFIDLVQSPKFSKPMIGGILRVIADFHSKLIKDKTAYNLPEPFDDSEEKNLNLKYVEMDSDDVKRLDPDQRLIVIKERNKAKLRESKSARVILRTPFGYGLTYFCYFFAVSRYQNEIARENLKDFLILNTKRSDDEVGRAKTIHMILPNVPLPKTIPFVGTENKPVFELLFIELEKYVSKLELLATKSPEIVDQLLLRLCDYITRSFEKGDLSCVTEDEPFHPDEDLAAIFDKAREEMEKIQPIILPKYEDFESSEDSSPSSPKNVK